MSESKAPYIRIERYTQTGCPACSSMKKSRVVEKFFEDKSNVKLEDYDLDIPNNEKRADGYGIKAIPAMVFLDEEDEVVHKFEGGVSKDGMEKLYKKVVKILEKEEETLTAQPWKPRAEA